MPQSKKPRYESFDVPVEGGLLHVGLWGRSGPVVAASHGLTATHISFEALAEQLGDDLRLVAPDHRGRGRSRDIEGPWGFRAHAADLVAVLDHIGAARADVLVGHSMGGFVAAVAAAEYPGRFAQVLMVDGGLPVLDAPRDGVSVERLLKAVLGPSMDRIDRRFESRQAYREFWRAHPAFAGDWSVYVERYADYDLIGAAPELVSSIRKEAILRDTESQLIGDLVPRSLGALQAPVRFLRAPRGITSGEALYAEPLLEAWGPRIGRFSHATVPDVNHFTIVISERGARALAEEIRRMLN